MSKLDQKIGAISTFIQRLDEATSTAKGKVIYFRGHSKASYKLIPYIYRNAGWIENEPTLLKELILRCPNDFADGMSTFEALVKMQHYSLPTRLLDLTSNPLVALYFACNIHSDDDEDGEVIILGYDIDQVKYFDSDTVSVISNLSRRPLDFQLPEEQDIEQFNNKPGIEYLLHDIRQEKPHFKSIIKPKDLRRVVCVKPKLDNPRIIRQDGAFLLFGIDGLKRHPANLEPDRILGRLVINRLKKAEILTGLELLGISKASLFPEIEQVATHIREGYKVPELIKGTLDHLHEEVLGILNQSEGSSIEEIAAQLGINKYSASRVTSTLNERGLIERLGSGRRVRWRTKSSVKHSAQQLLS